MTVVFIILATLAVLFFIGSVSKPALKPGDTRMEVDAPHPERCQDKTMIDFIAETANYKLEPIFKEYARLGYIIKPLYMDAYFEKLNKNYLNRKLYYEKANINEDPPRTADDIINEIRQQRDEERAAYKNSATFEVTGVHIPARKSFIKNYCDEDDWVELVPEPSNKFDKNAIKVRCNNKLIGYVASIDTLEVKEIIKNPHYAYISNKLDLDNYITVDITIEY